MPRWREGPVFPRRRTSPQPVRSIFPAHWESDAPLSDGSAVHIRPILPSDAQALENFHRELSETSRYLRFLTAKPELTAAEIERFTNVDHRDRVALIAQRNQRIIGVARFDRIEPHTAEVAVTVADALHGAGVGSLLMEHLIAAARECAITTFTADVMPSNQRMLALFDRLGNEFTHWEDDGLISARLDLHPTEPSRQALAQREHRSARAAAARVLEPKSIAVIGVSSRDDSPGGRILAALERSGYTGAVHVVSRDEFEVRGYPAVSSISALSEPCDLAVIALRPERCIEAVHECAAAGISAVMIPSEGFTDSAEHRDLHRQVVDTVRARGMRLLGPGSFGFVHTGSAPVDVSFVPTAVTPGATSILTQSSALSALVLGQAERWGMLVREFVSVGNEADVAVSDLVHRLADDAGTAQIVVAIDALRDLRRLAHAIRAAATHKPVLVMLPESDTAAAQAQMLTRMGATVIPGEHEALMNAAAAVARCGPPPGDRIGLLANTPALGQVLSSTADRCGLQVRIDNRSVPLVGSHRLLQRVFTPMAALDEVDVIIAAVLDPLVGDPVEMIQRMAQVARHSGVAVVIALVTTAERFAKVRAAVQDDPLLPPVFASPFAAVRAVAGMIEATSGQQRARGASPACPTWPAAQERAAHAARMRTIRDEIQRVLRASTELDDSAKDRLAVAPPAAGSHGSSLMRARAAGEARPSGVDLDAGLAADILRAFDITVTEEPHADGAHDDALEAQRAPSQHAGENPSNEHACIISAINDPEWGPILMAAPVSESASGDPLAQHQRRQFTIAPLNLPQARDMLTRVFAEQAGDAAAVRARATGRSAHSDIASITAIAELMVTLGEVIVEVPELFRLDVHLDATAQLQARARVLRTQARTPQRSNNETRRTFPGTMTEVGHLT